MSCTDSIGSLSIGLQSHEEPRLDKGAGMFQSPVMSESTCGPDVAFSIDEPSNCDVPSLDLPSCPSPDLDDC